MAESNIEKCALKTTPKPTGEITLKEICETKWSQLIDGHKRAHEKKIAVPVVSDDDTATLQIYHNKEKQLTAGIILTKNAPVEPLPNKDDILHQVYLDVLETSVKELEETLSLTRDQHKDMMADHKNEKKVNVQLLAVQAALQERLNQYSNEDRLHQDDGSIIEENEKEFIAVRTASLNLLGKMGFFINKHFPTPTIEETTTWLQKHGHSINDKESIEPFMPLLAIVEQLCNLSVTTPHDPYIKLDEKRHWQPYVTMLLRSGIVIRHPDEDSRIKLVPVHL